MPRMVESKTRFRFSQRELEALPPHDPDSPSSQMELSDTECIGLRFNKSKNGRCFWFFRYRWRGRKRALKLGEFPGMNLRHARERAWEMRGMMARGEEPREAFERLANTVTFGEFTEEHYLPHARNTVRRPDVIESRLNTGALPHFRDRRLDSITTRDVQQFHAKVREGRSPTTANHHLIVLKAMLNLAVKWEMIARNPCIGVKKFQEPQGRDRYLTQDEVKRFLAALEGAENPVVASGLRMLLFTGLRCREVYDLRWDDVDLEAQSILLRMTKSGKSRRVYLSAAAMDEILLMQSQRKKGHPYVFPGKLANKPVAQPNRTFKTACKRAKISDMRIHDLRHTFASHMVQSGASLFEVQKSLGHSSSQMTQRYAHLADSSLRDRADQTANRLTGTDG
ncbi:MAG: tyrosine-type recombinase/integrase [Candidatus Hydrogenedens sp.]|nr:tyrosine-type recombinase/integrase [Candidatus Hydrogenedens sp.]